MVLHVVVMTHVVMMHVVTDEGILTRQWDVMEGIYMYIGARTYIIWMGGGDMYGREDGDEGIWVRGGYW